MSATTILRAEWHGLLQHSYDARLHPDWILDPTSGPTPHIYTDYDEGNLSSLAVLRPEQVRPLKIGPRLTGYNLVGDRLLGDNSPAACTKFAATLADYLSDVDYIRLFDLESGGPLWNALGQSQDATYICMRRPVAHWWIDLPESSKEYWARFSGNTRRSFGKQARKLQRLGGKLHIYTTPVDLESLIPAVIDLYHSTWQYRRHGIAGSQFLSDLKFWKFAASNGVMRSYVLWLQDKPLAYEIGMWCGSNFIGIETGYDSTQPRLGSGTVLVTLIIDDLIANHARGYDLGFGDYSYKQSLGNRSTSSSKAMLIAKRVLPQSTLRLAFAALEARLALSAILKRIGIFHRVKALYHKIPKLH